MGRPKTLLVCGSKGCGKTSLIRRLLGCDWPDAPPPATIGLDESVGRIIFEPASPTSSLNAVAADATLPAQCCRLAFAELPAELRALMPPEGLELDIMEIGGGHGGHLRQVPRGSHLDCVLLCYDLRDRSSFRQTSHWLMLHGTGRHLAQGGAAAAAPSDAARAHSGISLAKLASVLCGTRADEAEARDQRAVSSDEADVFATSVGIRYSGIASACTGQGSQEVLHAIAIAILEAEEEAQAECEVAATAATDPKVWSLSRGKLSDEAGSVMTSPSGARPHEPREVCARHEPVNGPHLVEVLDEKGVPYASKPLATCMEKGLLHRGIHIWLCDPCSGGLLLRHYSRWAPKLPQCWGPTCCGEVLCYGNGPSSPVSEGRSMGLRPSETSADAAERIIQEQLGVNNLTLEFWFSSRSRNGNNQELLDVFIASCADSDVPPLRLAHDEDVEWVHFLEVFGSGGRSHLTSLAHVEETYVSCMVQKMRSRILHSDAAKSAIHPAFSGSGLASGRLGSFI
ncbi:unnamed protein product [Polarella glacialis]|uniref:Nudix hydrolase domain-containing protein n=2 Tax=Polarella glacialis TaxID=89957 RepID=A0A813FGM6_POLGL|nr:unnamed protein product [Polarella glacialis]